MFSADRVKDTTTTTGTGTVTVSGVAPIGYQPINPAIAVGQTFGYGISSAGAEWEIGIGTVLSATSFARTTVLSSSNAGALVSFSSGTKDVYCTLPAEMIPKRTVYTSSFCVSDASAYLTVTAFQSSDTSGVAACLDQRAQLQSILDMAVDGPLEVVWDGAYAVGNAGSADYCLKVRGNTVIRALPGCGAVLKSGANASMFVNQNRSITTITDKKITIDGGIWNFNGFNQTVQTDGMSFIGTSFLNVKNTRLLISKGFHCRIIYWDNARVENNYINAGIGALISSDGIHFNGPGQYAYINHNTIENCYDDSIAINADDSYGSLSVHGPYESYGPVTDVVIDGNVLNGALYGVRLLTGGSRMDRVAVRNTLGKTSSYGLIIDCFNPSTIVASGSGNFGKIEVSGFDMENAYINGSTQACMSINGKIDMLSITDVKRTTFQNSEFPTVLFGQYTNIKQLRISGFQSYPLVGTAVINQIKLLSGAIIESMMVNSCDFTAGTPTSGYPININSGATINRLTLNGNTGSGFTDFVTNAGTVTNLHVPATNNFMDSATAVSASTWLLTSGYTEQSATGVTFNGPVNAFRTALKTTNDAYNAHVQLVTRIRLTGAITGGTPNLAAGLILRGAAGAAAWDSTTTSYFFEARVVGSLSGFRIATKSGNTEHTIIGPIGTVAINTDYDVTFTTKGSVLSAKVQRVSDGFYLQTDGTFAATAVTALSATDTALGGGTSLPYGVYTNASNTDNITVSGAVFSNFVASAAP